MIYVSKYALGDKFTIERLKLTEYDYIPENIKCYVSHIIALETNYIIQLSVAEDYLEYKKDDFLMHIYYCIEDYYKEPEFAQTYPTYLEIQDVIIDSFTKRWFELESIEVDYKNGIEYFFKSSDGKEINYKEEKIRFYIKNNIFKLIRYKNEK